MRNDRKSKPIRILAISYLFPNSLYPNYGIFVLNRLKAVQKYCEVKVINPIPWFPFNSRLKRYRNYDQIPAKEVIAGVEVLHPRFFTIPRYLKILDAASFFFTVFPLALKISKTFPFDLIDVHWPYPDLPTGNLLARVFRRKQLITLRGREALFSHGRWLYKKIIVPLISRSDVAISLSQEMVDICVTDRVLPEKFRVIRNGVNTITFRYLEKTACREKLGLPQGERIVLSVGSLIHGKGFDRIIKAFPEVLREHPDASLYIAGSEGPAGADKRALTELVLRYSLEGKINFVGELKNHDLVLWYNAADVFCLASRGEGSPNVLSEALTCGCPSIATDVGSVSEILNNDSLGTVVSNDDESILPGLMSVLSGKYDRKWISSLMKQYDWDWCARQVIQVYQEALEK